MTVYRTVELSEEQVHQFEKLAFEHGFVVVEDTDPEIPKEIQDQMAERAENWNATSAISKEQLLSSFRDKGWDGK
ncbi:MAG TPA: hypothetical protein PK509_12935 [Catalimonadaceae bacterium]|mgnify:FL=1|nr:hypothetical protein [Catalimonadaceae bacterium]